MGNSECKGMKRVCYFLPFTFISPPSSGPAFISNERKDCIVDGWTYIMIISRLSNFKFDRLVMQIIVEAVLFATWILHATNASVIQHVPRKGTSLLLKIDMWANFIFFGF